MNAKRSRKFQLCLNRPYRIIFVLIKEPQQPKLLALIEQRQKQLQVIDSELALPTDWRNNLEAQSWIRAMEDFANF